MYFCTPTPIRIEEAIKQFRFVVDWLLCHLNSICTAFCLNLASQANRDAVRWPVSKFYAPASGAGMDAQAITDEPKDDCLSPSSVPSAALTDLGRQSIIGSLVRILETFWVVSADLQQMCYGLLQRTTCCELALAP